MNKNDLRKINNADNILILPGNKSPERLLASYLYNLSDVDPLWSKIADGYTKQFCFREYSMEQINAGGELGRQNAKKWFNSQLEYWGRNGCKVLNPFLSSISEEAQEFRTNFDNMINSISMTKLSVSTMKCGHESLVMKLLDIKSRLHFMLSYPNLFFLCLSLGTIKKACPVC